MRQLSNYMFTIHSRVFSLCKLNVIITPEFRAIRQELSDIEGSLRSQNTLKR